MSDLGSYAISHSFTSLKIIVVPVLSQNVKIMDEEFELTDPFIKGLKPAVRRKEIYDGKTKGLAIRLSETGRRTFVYRYRYGKSVKRYTIGTYPKMKLAAARKKVGELDDLLRDGIDPLAEKQKNKNRPAPVTVESLSDLFIEKHLPKLKKSTREDYERRIKIIKSEVGSIPAKDLSRSDIISFLEDILEENEAPIQSNRLRAILSSMYSFGVNRGLVDYNPVQQVKPLASEQQRNRVYNDNEIKIIWSRFEMEIEPFRSILKMLLICGQRAGETRLTKWEHISDDYLWHIPSENTKANREQNIPLPELGVTVLNELKEITGDKDYVFASPREENEPISWLQNVSKRVRDNCSVDDFRLHDLRRTVASNLARLGYDRTIIGKTLNHKGLAGDSMVTAVYDRYDYIDEKRVALQSWSDHLISTITLK
jgi:integrase